MTVTVKVSLSFAQTVFKFSRDLRREWERFIPFFVCVYRYHPFFVRLMPRCLFIVARHRRQHTGWCFSTFYFLFTMKPALLLLTCVCYNTMQSAFTLGTQTHIHTHTLGVHCLWHVSGRRRVFLVGFACKEKPGGEWVIEMVGLPGVPHRWKWIQNTRFCMCVLLPKVS